MYLTIVYLNFYLTDNGMQGIPTTKRYTGNTFVLAIYLFIY